MKIRKNSGSVAEYKHSVTEPLFIDHFPKILRQNTDARAGLDGAAHGCIAPTKGPLNLSIVVIMLLFPFYTLKSGFPILFD